MISVVIPVYNEEACLEALFERLSSLEQQGQDRYEFIFVDDGSTDRSREIIQTLAAGHDNVKYVLFSRNFGHEAAVTAGLDYASGDAVVIIDADLQDPPELIPEMIDKWRQGYQIVYAQRRSRKGERISKRLSAWLFYRIIQWLSPIYIPADTGDFRLIDRRVVQEFRRCREQNRFVRGLISWTGFKQAPVLFDRNPRYGGKTKYDFFRLLLLAVDVVVGFSNVPLRIGMFLGFLTCTFSFLVALWIVFNKLVFDIPIEGYALLATGVFFLGGAQLLIIGLLGEYIGRIYRQVQGRPLYVVADKSENLEAGT